MLGAVEELRSDVDRGKVVRRWTRGFEGAKRTRALGEEYPRELDPDAMRSRLDSGRTGVVPDGLLPGPGTFDSSGTISRDAAPIRALAFDIIGFEGHSASLAWPGLALARLAGARLRSVLPRCAAFGLAL